MQLCKTHIAHKHDRRDERLGALTLVAFGALVEPAQERDVGHGGRRREGRERGQDGERHGGAQREICRRMQKLLFLKTKKAHYRTFSTPKKHFLRVLHFVRELMTTLERGCVSHDGVAVINTGSLG
jgi:hypothetical protein